LSIAKNNLVAQAARFGIVMFNTESKNAIVKLNHRKVACGVGLLCSECNSLLNKTNWGGVQTYQYKGSREYFCNFIL
jgi:hypothetical protein